MDWRRAARRRGDALILLARLLIGVTKALQCSGVRGDGRDPPQEKTEQETGEG